jgi:hypothetical protein
MPGRIGTWLIVIGWLGMASWFVLRDVAPYWRTDGAPPFIVDLADELTTQLAPVRWVVTYDGKPIGSTRTWTEYHRQDDTFELVGETRELTLPTNRLLQVKINKLTNGLRVTRAGELRGVVCTGSVSVSAPLLLRGQTLEAAVDLHATVRERQLHTTVALQLGNERVDRTLAPQPVTSSTALNPLMPLNRVVGLRPGQRWQIPRVDPLGDAIRGAVEEYLKLKNTLPTGNTVLMAEVLTTPRPLEWPGRVDACWVIEYRAGDEVRARTWVRISDGTVLRQEANNPGEPVLALQRQ